MPEQHTLAIIISHEREKYDVGYSIITPTYTARFGGDDDGRETNAENIV